MALIPENQYAGQVITGAAGYPHGKARNVTVSGDGTGTPLEANWVNDDWGFKQALLDHGGITPSGVPDALGASQYLDAIKRVTPRCIFTYNPSSGVTYQQGDAAISNVTVNALSVQFDWSVALVSATTSCAVQVQWEGVLTEEYRLGGYMFAQNGLYVIGYQHDGTDPVNTANWHTTDPFSVVIWGLPG